MEYKEKRLNKFSLSMIGAGMLVVAALILIRLSSALDSVSGDLSGMSMNDVLGFLMSAASSLKSAFILLILLIIAGIVLLAGSLCRYVRDKEKRLCYVIYTFSGAMTTYTGIKMLSLIFGIKDLISAGLQGGLSMLGGSFDADLMGIASNAAGVMGTALVLYGLVKYTLIALLFTGVYAGYCVYSIKKHGLAYEGPVYAEPPAADISASASEGRHESFEAGMEKAKRTGKAIGKKTQEVSNSIAEKVKGLDRRQKLAAAGVIAAVIVAFGGFKIYDTFFNYDKIDLMEGLGQPTFYGYDGAGEVDTYPYMGDIDYDMTKEGMAEFLNSVTYTIDKTEGLSNGDEVTVTAVYSEATAKALKIKVTEATATVKVEGLRERYADGNAIPEKTVKSISEAMDQRAEEKIQASYEFQGEKTSWERLGIIFARDEAQEPEYSAYDDIALGIYQVTGEKEKKYLTVFTMNEIDSETDLENLSCETSYFDSNFVDGIRQYLQDDGGHTLTMIGESEKSAATLEEWYSNSLLQAARITYPALVYPSQRADSWDVTVDKNTVTYEYSYDREISDIFISDKKKSIKEAMADEEDNFKEVIEKLEEQSGIEGLTLKIRFVDEKGTVLYKKEFSK